MVTLWLMRHAPSPQNVAGVIMGGTADPEPLPEELERAALAGTALEGRFSRVLASPQRRALLTAQAAFPQVEVRVDERLRERDLGEWQGAAKQSLPADVLSRAGSVRLGAAPPNGESPRAFGVRVRSLLEELARLHDGETLIAVTHNGVIRMALFLSRAASLEEASDADVRFLEPLAVEVSADTLVVPEQALPG